MSRVSVLESLYSKKKSALEFNYDNLWAPPIRSLLSQDDINELIRIATSLKYNGKINLKYKLINQIMNRRGFRKAHSGTNRVVYNYLEDPRFVAKIAVDRVGMKDNPAEYKNQRYFAPFCCKIFEVDESGVIAFIERVNPITSLEEFLSVSDDIFNMIVTKIIGKYVVDDIGTTKYMNFGLRMNGFGPVILDFPYAYELDGRKLICNKKIKTPFGEQPCGGEIDYDNGFNYLICTKCGRTYQARDLTNDTKDVLILNNEGRLNIMSKMRIVDRKTRKIIVDDHTSTSNYISKEEYNEYMSKKPEEFHPVEKVSYVKTKKKVPKEKMNSAYYTKLMLEKFNKNANAGFNISLDEVLNGAKEVKVSKTITNGKVDDHSSKEESKEKSCEEIVKVSVPGVKDDDQMKLSQDEIDRIEASHEEEDNNKSEVEKAVDTLVNKALKNVLNDNPKPEINEDINQDRAINEIDLKNFSIGQNVKEEEQDYSNYDPDNYEDNSEPDPEEDINDTIDYADYVENIKKEKKHKHKYDDDMDEY